MRPKQVLNLLGLLVSEHGRKLPCEKKECLRP